MKKIIIAVLFLIHICHIPASAFKYTEHGKEIMKKAEEYLTLKKKGSQSEAYEMLKEACMLKAQGGSGHIPENISFILYSTYIVESVGMHKDINQYSYFVGNIIISGPKSASKITDYTRAILTAYANLHNAGISSSKFRAEYALCAKHILENIKSQNVALEIKDEYRPFLEACRFHISENLYNELRTEVGNLCNNLRGNDWFVAGEYLMRNSTDRFYGQEYNYKELTKECIEQGKRKNSSDIYALEGHMYMNGIIYPKDPGKATECYKRGCRMGSLWGAVQTANILMNEGKYKDAYKLLQKHESNPDFCKEGGEYIMGRIYEQGVVKNKSGQDALQLYLNTYSNCKYPAWQKDAKKRNAQINVNLATKEIDQDIKEAGGLSKLKPLELMAYSKRYSKLKNKDKSLELCKRAADLGLAQAANQYAVALFHSRFFNQPDEIRFDMSEVAKYIGIALEQDYLPAHYNNAIMHLYGLGVAPDHDISRESYNEYVRLLEDESISDYEPADYIPFIDLESYNKSDIMMGRVLKKMLERYDTDYGLYNDAGMYSQEMRIYFLKKSAALGYRKAAEALTKIENK